jgi:hypothetical protein
MKGWESVQELWLWWIGSKTNTAQNRVAVFIMKMQYVMTLGPEAIWLPSDAVGLAFSEEAAVSGARDYATRLEHDAEVDLDLSVRS